jgi:hypothetical protein
MLTGGKQLLIRSSRRAGRFECGRNASCQQVSRPCQVGLFFKRKRDGRYNARLVVGGHRQQHGLDFSDTFAPVCSYRTMRMILAVSAHEDLVLQQFDVCTGFLNGELEVEVYVRPPPGAEHLAVGNKRVIRLRRALYGLKQASHAWNKGLEGELRVKGAEQFDADPALWILHGEGGAVLVMFYVDDGLVAAKHFGGGGCSGGSGGFHV